jgi:hypothetical protein
MCVDKMLGGRIAWVGMSRGRFVGGHNVKAPIGVLCTQYNPRQACFPCIRF